METPEGWGICVKEAEELEVGIRRQKHGGNRAWWGQGCSKLFIADSNMIEMILVAFGRRNSFRNIDRIGLRCGDIKCFTSN